MLEDIIRAIESQHLAEVFEAAGHEIETIVPVTSMSQELIDRCGGQNFRKIRAGGGATGWLKKLQLFHQAATEHLLIAALILRLLPNTNVYTPVRDALL